MTYGGDYRISALFEEIGHYHSPFLEQWDKSGLNWNFIADSPEWLIQELIPYLINFLNSKEEGSPCFEVFEGIKEQDFEIVLALLIEAKNMGFFNEVQPDN